VVEDIVKSQQPKIRKTKETFIRYARVSVPPHGQELITAHKRMGHIGQARTVDYRPSVPRGLPRGQEAVEEVPHGVFREV
jgi:hypothetical protein